jgi:hypothetical protein
MRLETAVLLIVVALGAAPEAQAQGRNGSRAQGDPDSQPRSAASQPQGGPHTRSQQRQTHAQSQLPPLMPPVPPLPAIGLPLPAIGLPQPDVHSHRPGATGNQPAGPRRPSERWRGPGVSPYVLLVPYGIEVPVDAARPQDSPPISPEQRPSTGMLWMDIEPAGDWQLFVDGFYVGTTSEFRSGLELDAGPHAIEIRAAGYDTLRFAVNISASRSMTYRDTLSASNGASPLSPSARVPEPAASVVPMTLYVIPGCYAGNVPPEVSTLPKGCEQSRLSTVRR